MEIGLWTFHRTHEKKTASSEIAQSAYICSLMVDFVAETMLLMVNYKQICDWLRFWVRFFVEATTHIKCIMVSLAGIRETES